MNESPVAETDRVRTLREAFDSTFSLAPPVPGEPPEDLLAIGVGQAPYALRLSEITGLYVDRPITMLPDAPPELLGIVGFRGAIVAVYDLRVLLGAEGATPGRWLVLAPSSSAVGFAFDQFDGHLRVPREAIASGEIGPTGSSVREVVRVGEVLRPIVKIQALLEAITAPEEH